MIWSASADSVEVVRAALDFRLPRVVAQIDYGTKSYPVGIVGVTTVMVEILEADHKSTFTPASGIYARIINKQRTDLTCFCDDPYLVDRLPFLIGSSRIIKIPGWKRSISCVVYRVGPVREAGVGKRCLHLVLTTLDEVVPT